MTSEGHMISVETANGISIRNGPIEVDRNAPLWRYVTLPTLLSYLSGRLRFSSVKRLRGLDPFEGLSIWDHVTQASAFSHQEYNALFDYIRDRHLSKSDQELLRVNAGCPGYNQQIIFQRWQALTASTRYCLCFFENKHESMAMWRLYAPHGFAIQTTAFHLEHALRATNHCWRITRLAYINKTREVVADQVYRNPLLMEGLKRPWILKGHEYEYEREVRIATVDPRGEENLVVDDVAPHDWIRQIRISSEMWPQDADVLRTLISERCPPLASVVHQSSATRPPQDGSEMFWAEAESDAKVDEAKSHWPDLLWEP